MTTRGPRLVLVHGSDGLAGRLGALARELDLDCRSGSVEDLERLAASGGAAVVVAEAAALDGGALARLAPAGSESTVPLVAVGCGDAAAVASALQAGALLAARSDAGDDELRSLLRACADVGRLRRECELVRSDLARQSTLVVKDDLTAAFNRRFFDRFVAERIDGARRNGGSVGLVFMDIDNLKAVNLRHGHSMGSLVLREAAKRLMEAVAGDDRVTRYGGDEFCIVLPGRDGAASLHVAEAIRRAFAAAPFAVDDTGGVTLTACFGVACYPDHGGDVDSLVRAADEAMRKVKDHKNGIRLAGT